MLNKKLLNIFIFFCIISFEFNVFANQLSDLSNNINEKLNMTVKDLSNNTYTISVFPIESITIYYAHFDSSEDLEVNKCRKLNIFYIFMNCSFADLIQIKLHEFIRMFPLPYKSKFQNIYKTIYKNNLFNIITILNNIQFCVRRFIDTLLSNFIYLSNSNQNYDTSLLKTLLLLNFKIDFVILNKEIGNVVIRSILGIINLIQSFESTNCGEFTSEQNNLVHTPPDFSQPREFFGYWIKTPKSDIQKTLSVIKSLGLYSRTVCSAGEMVLRNFLKRNRTSISNEIYYAKVKTKCGTIVIYQILRLITKRHQCDFKFILWYQESIVNVIVKLIYTKIITALHNKSSKRGDIVQLIPNFIHLPHDFAGLFKKKEDELIKIITNRRDSMTDITLPHASEYSSFKHFTTALKSKKNEFLCFISLLNFLRDEYANVPFVTDSLSFTHIMKLTNNLLSIVNSVPQEDNSLWYSMCTFVRDLYSLCLKVTIIFKMIDGKDEDSADNYTRQMHIILKTIRERSIMVIERCTHKGCKNLLRVLYDICVVLDLQHFEKFTQHQSRIMTMTMSILNEYAIDHCNPPNFSYLYFKSIDFKATGYNNILKNRFDTFLRSIQTNQNPRIMVNLDEFLNIKYFYQNYVVKDNFFTEYIHKITFFWNGEKKNIQEIYENISSMVLHPTRVYQFYNVYFELVIGLVYHKIWDFIHNIIINSNMETDTYNSDECLNFSNLCSMLLKDNNFPNNCSILLAALRQFSTLVYKVCSQKIKISMKYIKIININEATTVLENHETNVALNALYVGLKVQHQFKKVGIIVQQEKPLSLSSVKPYSEIFNNLNVKFINSIKSANKMMTKYNI